MRVHRYQVVRRKRIPIAGCGCLGVALGGIVICGLVLLIIAPALPALALRFTGFQPQGATETFFNNRTSATPPTLQNTVNTNVLTLTAGEYRWSVPLTAMTGDLNGQAAVQIIFSEAQLAEVCNQIGDICGEEGYPLRNGRFDLRSGGGILYGDVFVSQLGIWQSLGFVWRVSANNRIEFTGVDMGGALYALPSGPLSQQALEAEAFANRLLETLLAQTEGGQFRLTHLSVDDNALIATFR